VRDQGLQVRRRRRLQPRPEVLQSQVPETFTRSSGRRTFQTRMQALPLYKLLKETFFVCVKHLHLSVCKNCTC
jgi:hypothetical protein